MPVVLTQQNNLLAELLWEGINEFGRPVRGETQKDQARNEGYKQGRLEGICNGAAAIINTRRQQRFPLADMMDMLDEWVIRKSIGEGEIRELKDQFDTNLASIDKNLTGDEKAQLRDRYSTNFWNALGEIIEGWTNISPQWMASYEGWRRERVIEGEIPPTIEDEDWIAERIEQSKLDTQSLERLFQKAQNPKVNN